MSKILSQAGSSLSPQYNIEDSRSGPSEVDFAEPIRLVHEMGGVMFSERVDSTILRLSSGAIAQSLGFDAVLDEDNGLPMTPFFIRGVFAIVSNTGRMTNLAINVRDPLLGNETPIMVWDATNVDVVRMRILNAAATVANVLRPLIDHAVNPVFMTGNFSRSAVSEIALRGNTSAFGAGTVTTTLFAHITFARLGGVNSRGLPLPSW